MGGWVGDCSSRLAVLHVSWVSVGLGGSLWVDFGAFRFALLRAAIDRSGAGLHGCSHRRLRCDR